MIDEDNKAQEREIKRMTAEGLQIRPTVVTALGAGGKLRNYLNDSEAHSKTIGKLNLATCRPLYDEPIKVVQVLETVVGDKSLVEKEGLSSMVDSDLRVVQMVKASAVGLIERYEKKAFASSEPQTTLGTPSTATTCWSSATIELPPNSRNQLIISHNQSAAE